MKYKYIFFDFNGTLLDDVDLVTILKIQFSLNGASKN